MPYRDSYTDNDLSEDEQGDEGLDDGPDDDSDDGDSPLESDDDRPRDEQGRFLPQEGEEEPDEDDEVPPDEDEELDEDAQPPATEQVPTGEAPPGAAKEGEREYERLTFRSGGEAFEIDGSYITEDGGGYIPKDHIAEVLTLVQRGIHHQRTYPQERARYEGRIRDLESQLQSKSNEQLEAEHILDFFAELKKGGRQKAIEWFDKLEQNWAVLEADARAAAAEARASAIEQSQQQVRAREDGEQWVQYQQDALEKAIYKEVARTYGEAGLTDDDLVPLYRLLYATKDSIIFRAQYDMPEANARKGQVVIDYLPVRNALDLFMSTRGKADDAAANAAEAARRNARRGRTVTPRPVVRGNRTTADQRQKKRRFVARTREEAEQLAFRTPVDVANKLIRGEREE